MGLGALALWALLFAHPLLAVFTVLVFGTFLAVELALNRENADKRVFAAALVMLLPVTLTAAAVSFGSERFGTRLGDVASPAEIMAPALDLGPIEIWEPLKLRNRAAGADASQAAAYFVSGHAVFSEPRVAFLGNELPFAHWQKLANSENLIVLLACIVIILGRHRDQVALWTLASTLVATSVFVLPPLAALVARFVTPWQLWRFSWLMPVPLAAAWLVAHWLPRTRWKLPGATALGVVLVATFLSTGHGIEWRSSPRVDSPVEAAVADLEGLEGTILADPPVQNAAASRYGSLHAVSYRGLATMDNSFPAMQRGEAFARFQDARRFYMRSTTQSERLDLLDEHEIRLVLLNLDDHTVIDPEELGLEPSRPVGPQYVLYTRTP
jgi:hypothetical protein